MDIGLAILMFIAVILFMIYLSTRSIVEAINHWGAAHESYQLKIIKELREPGPNRIWFLGDAFRLGLSIEEIFQHSKIDPWFLYQIKDLIEIEEKTKKMTIKSFSSEILFDIKRKGFSDSRIAKLVKKKTKDIRTLRYKHKIHPVYKRVDTCAAEFEATSTYLYSTYEKVCESNASNNKKIIRLI